jgi:NADPH-dependent 2,4-dienoyl-CoA reductase/sulfur reductase-like enzyme
LHVVIVGNGVAGMEAALAIRGREAEWAITIVSEESDHFFSRTALMYVLAGQMSYRDIEPLERDVYVRLGFRRVRARAAGLDPARHVLVLGNGEELSYDKLILACGSRPNPPPWQGCDTMLGVGHFVTLQDLQWLERSIHGRHGVDLPPRHALTAAWTPGQPYTIRPAPSHGRPVRRPVVVGGGLIGIEVVETLLAAGLRPTFVVADEWYWPISLDDREAAWVAEALRAHGADVRLGERVEEVLQDGQNNVAGLRTANGTIEADLLVVAIGVVPHTRWLGDAVLRDELGGILVNDRLRASVPDVWACGDCASVRCFDGRIRPEQLWYTARDQGRVAGAGVLGDKAVYKRPVLYNSAKLMDIEFTTVGLVNQKVDGELSWFHEEKGRVRSTTRIVHAGGQVIGFNFLGRRWDHTVCVRWIEERRSLEYVLARLGEAAFDTEFVPRLAVGAP